MKKSLNLWLPVLLWMGVIFIGSSIGSMPQVGGDTTDAIVHRTAHLIEFALLGWLVLRALSDGRLPDRRTFIIALIVVTVYGASDELHQRFTPGRSSELSAVVFDAVGGLIGLWAWRWKARKSASQRIASAGGGLIR
ncbi:MAG: VanZ family protein [Chloroflexi bacterium]|nr:VanZ family protein [Chloroflexota bacterium]